MKPTKSLIISLLHRRPDQPQKALYQHSFPYSRKWGYLLESDGRILAFDEQDVHRLHHEGVVQFIEDRRGRQCVILTEPLLAAGHAANAVAAEASVALAELKARDQENRRLLVGDGPTFAELQRAGKAGGGTPYRFGELLKLNPAALVPPLVFIHVPRTAGTTLNKILMRNYKYRADSYGSSFFPPYFPSHFLSLVQPSGSADDRIRPAFFTGHIDLANDIFRYMPVRYIAATLLRDPVERIISHYRFNSTQPSIFQNAIRERGIDVVGYLTHFGAAIPLQYQLFAPASDAGEEERSAQALRNLETSVSLFGLQEQFDGFVSMLAALLGLPDVSHKVLNKLPSGAATVTVDQIERLRPLLKHDLAFYEGASKMYRHRTVFIGAQRLPGAEHPWGPFYA